MTMDDAEAGLSVGMIVGVILTSLILLTGEKVKSDIGYRDYGSATHTCFANRTCREDLQCHVTQSMPDGICLEK